MANKICPFRLLAAESTTETMSSLTGLAKPRRYNPEFLACLRGDCEWWDGSHCAIHSVATILSTHLALGIGKSTRKDK